MSDLSGLQDLSVARLPLTQEQRDELNRVVLKTSGHHNIDFIAQSDPTRWDEDEGHYTIASLIIILAIDQARALLQREMLQDNLAMMDICGVLQEAPKLRGIIHEFCRNRLFSDIADLKIFQIPQAMDLPTRSVQDKDPFSRPYVGQAVVGFYEYLRENIIKFEGGGVTRRYYGRFCSIVQSSGTGKSRLLIELRNKGVLVLYMNLRERRDAGFPRRDAVPARILTEEMDCTRAEYTARCCALFTAIFQALRQELSNKLRLGSDDPIKSWNDEMCDMGSKARTKFFQEVQSLYEEVRAQPRGGESSVTEAHGKMRTVLSEIFAKKAGDKDFSHPKLVISFDDAHSLSNMSSDGFRPSNILGRVINCYSKHSGASESAWVVFASTTPHVVDVPAPQVIYNSLRVVPDGHLVFPPYMHLGWDQNADSPYDISAKEVGKFNHIVGFGRPLWKSLVPKDSVAEILQLAAVKLCTSSGFNPLDTNQALAVLSQRFGLDICFGHPDAAACVDKGVASHLRICFSTTQDRSWTFTGYPSEPLLSCVAAILLHSYNSTSLEDALRVLKEKVDGGMVEIGQNGELASRLVLLLAKDMYVRSHFTEGTIRDLRYFGYGDVEIEAELIDCQKVSVVDFLPYLFGKTFWSFPAGEKAKTAFQHAYINFSHWVSMTELISPRDSKKPTSDLELSSVEEWTLRHWHRTSAVQCCPLQPLVDKMIPIYFDDPALGSDDLKRVSQIFISDNAGKNPNVKGLAAITRTDDSIQCLSTLPYIAMLLDFNVESKLDVTFSETDPNNPETDGSLRIYASGMNYTTFPSDVMTRLQGLVSREEEAPIQTSLDALVGFGSTTRLCNVQWEAQA